jgi:hypothetical protein
LDRQICAAIKSKHHLLFNYDDLPREIEPHPHSASSNGKEVVRGFQTDGQSSSGPLGWRLWDVAKRESFRVSDFTFTDARPGYVRGDSHMTPVHCKL